MTGATMSAAPLGIIGGSGLTQLAELDARHREVVRTPYGEPSGPLTFGSLAGGAAVFLARHGHGHTIAPHEVNYRANLWALRHAGVRRVVSVVSVGGIRADLGPGVIAVPHQLLDYTWGRHSTFFEGPDQPVTHVDFTHPFTAAAREAILVAASAAGEPVVPEGVYATTQGPRLETAAEIDRLERDGATMVGMTAMPEAVLAREIGLEYAALAVVANHAAGRGQSGAGIRLEDIRHVLQQGMARARRILQTLSQAHGGT